MSGQSRDLQHDGRASLRIEYRRSGWRVVRTCACHLREPVTMSFDSREEAIRALEALDDDARRGAP
jgi:hypothetical protein